jgi:hypothetical protein
MSEFPVMSVWEVFSSISLLCRNCAISETSKTLRYWIQKQMGMVYLDRPVGGFYHLYEMGVFGRRSFCPDFRIECPDGPAHVRHTFMPNTSLAVHFGPKSTRVGDSIRPDKIHFPKNTDTVDRSLFRRDFGSSLILVHRRKCRTSMLHYNQVYRRLEARVDVNSTQTKTFHLSSRTS